jgi:cytochrome c peroxidase
MPIAIDQPFAAIMAHDVAAKPGIEPEHQAVLEERYDLDDHPAQGVTIERGKPLQEGVRVKLPPGVTWEQLAAMSPDDIRERGLWPKGFLPLPHPLHPAGGFVFPKEEIDAIKRQGGRDLTRFDIDFDLPERFLGAFPPAMYLVSRPDLGFGHVAMSTQTEAGPVCAAARVRAEIVWRALRLSEQRLPRVIAVCE